ncbi:MAG: hypothetical protein Q9197_000203 [Variospora fuerteventurae]
MDKFMPLDTATRLPKWEPRLFPTGLTVAELMERLGAPAADEADPPARHYGLREVQELGEGRWAAGQVVLQGSEQAGKTLREMGWLETRGWEAAKPVWLKIHEESR